MKQTVSSGLDLIRRRKDRFQPYLARHEEQCNNVFPPKVWIRREPLFMCTNGIVPHIVEKLIGTHKLIKKSDANTSS